MWPRLSSRFILIGVMAGLAFLAATTAMETLRSQHRHVEPLMAGTAYETPMYILDSGRKGATVLVLGGVHGDEPGGWLAADELVERGPPLRGKLLVIPRANRLAIDAEVRSTPGLGDLNRLYFAPNDAFPMGRMAREIEDVVRRYAVNVVLDLHESWDFHQKASDGEAVVDLGALGQTISPHGSQPSRRLAARVVSIANGQLHGQPKFRYHEFPEGHVDALLVPLPPGTSDEDVLRRSALDLPAMVPGVASLLVEVGHQQPVEARVRQQLAVVEALLAVAE